MLLWVANAAFSAQSEMSNLTGFTCEQITQDKALTEGRILAVLIQSGLGWFFDKEGNAIQVKYGADKAMLTDNIVGPVTLGWLRDYCVESEFLEKVSAISENSRLIVNSKKADATRVLLASALVEDLIFSMELENKYPDWQALVQQPDFETWFMSYQQGLSDQTMSSETDSAAASDTPTLSRDDFNTPVTLHSSMFILQAIDAYVAQHQPTVAATPNITVKTVNLPDVYFQVTEADLLTLQTVNSVVTALNNQRPEMETQLAARNAIRTTLQPLIDGGVISPTGAIDNWIGSLVVPVLVNADDEGDDSDASASASTTKQVSETTANTSATTTVTTTNADNTTTTTTSVSEQQSTAQTETATDTTQSFVYTVTDDSFQQFLSDSGFSVISEDAMAQLTSLVAVEFNTANQLYMAVTQPQALELTPSQFTWLRSVATKSGLSDQTLSPLSWSGNDCNCSLQATDSELYSNFIYGFYPFWQSELGEYEPEAINYNVLTRIGYYGVSLNEAGTVDDWLHLKNKKPYSEFVNDIHKYRAKLDMVLTDRIDEQNSTLSRTELANARVSKFDDELVLSLALHVKTELNDYFFNRIRPTISFGVSRVRTLADGITLDLDLADMTDPEQMKQVTRFIVKLKMTLNDVAFDENKLSELPNAKNDDDFYVNLMVNYHDLGKGYYIQENMDILADYLNIILVVVDPIDIPSSYLDASQTVSTTVFSTAVDTDNAQETAEASEDDSAVTQAASDLTPAISLMEALHAELDSKSSVLNGLKIMEKLVPVLANNKYTEEEFTATVKYSEWNYGGVGLWTMPLTVNETTALSSLFFVEPSSAVEVALEPVCKIVCPNRWPARLLLFLVVVVSVTLAVASIWFYKLQRFYRTSWFVVYLVALAVFIMLVLWCDPYWQSQHLLILACLMAFVIGVVFVRALLQRNASQFP